MRVFVFYIALLTSILVQFTGYAQEVPIKQIDRNTFSFSTKDLILIKDFAIEGPTYHITDVPYSFSISALTETGNVDSTVTGVFPFIVNGTKVEASFRKGEAPIEFPLGEAKLLHVQLADTKIERTMEITRMPEWPAMAGIAVFLLITWFFRHTLARWFRKMTGDKTTR